MSSEIQSTIKDEMKLAMKARAKQRLGVIRLMQAEFKRIEVDERIELDDARVLAVLDKMIKQRRDSVKQYEDAERQELADQETFEIGVISEFLPQALTPEEISALIEDALDQVEATGMKAMGQVMAILKPKIQGRADIGKISSLLKAKLN
ncbi:MAG: hypothetical protein ACI80S_000424 [Pseudohongiellaceae bacterium]|jgi:uncharacterized protein YqeY